MKTGLNIATSVSIKTRIVDAKTNRVIKDNPWRKNLVLNSGLNGVARDNTLGLSTQCNSLNSWCLIGSGTTPTSYASGAITFTQAGTTVTASGGFFTALMVGMLFKYGSGSGGAEYYITGYTSATQVTVDTSATVGSPTVATVWAVNQTQLATFLYKSNTYQTNPNDCETTYTGDTISFKRTITFPVQASPYTVNEIGYAPSSTASNYVAGRIVLPAGDVVGTANYYVVVIQVNFTFSPATPTAVGNVGTNIDTSGTSMLEYFATGVVTSAGASSRSPTNDILNDVAASLFFITQSGYTQNSSINSANGITPTGVAISTTAARTYLAGSIGKCRYTWTTGTASTTGQNCYGIALRGTSSNFDIKFTAPQALPNGTLQPSAIFELTFGRALIN